MIDERNVICGSGRQREILGTGLALGAYCQEMAKWTTPEQALTEARRAMPGLPDAVLRITPTGSYIFDECRAWGLGKSGLACDAVMARPYYHPLTSQEARTIAAGAVVLGGVYKFCRFSPPATFLPAADLVLWNVSQSCCGLVCLTDRCISYNAGTARSGSAGSRDGYR